jgi:protein-disulfide isomerase
MYGLLSRRIGWLVLILISLVVVAACAAPIIQPPAAAVGQATPPPAVEAPEEPAEAPPVPVGQETHQGAPVGFTEEGYPYRGDPNAPITVHEFSDYQCPFCARHAIQTEPALDQSYIRGGDARFIFRDFPVLQPNSFPAAIAANCVAEQGIVPFWEMHGLLFRTQQEWARAEDPSDIFARLATEAGADADRYAVCLEERVDEITAVIQQNVAEGRSYGLTGTPSFRFINEETAEVFTLVGAQPYEVFASYIETILAGGAPADPAQAQQQPQGEPQLPFWATEEGLTPDPENPDRTLAGDFWRGNPDAPLVVVEFSDFQCPFCRRHATDTQPVLDEQFVDPGDVMWVFKHFPVEQTHPQAIPAHVASECAGRQGHFWEMHHLIFENVQAWSNPDVEEVMTSYAAELGLDVEAFTACQAAEDALREVATDFMDGSQFIRGTPTFVVLYNGIGRIIPGALPADQFSQALEMMLEEAQAGQAE